ncbi:12266_t:CDS:2 [Gigaspora margarita]|uniref:12266_t:CDS:1 n=1 Tax=Gigaspora margarita TaxID=4874 RepID=A0ABN7UHQ6_GIGMA|nr:12266_t:CDS:2 [Gigaspora margarita]
MLPKDCSACSREVQTLLHFVLKCKISRMIWTEAYKCLATLNNDRPSQSWDEIFSASNIEDTSKYKHIICLYEIWYWYTQVK